MGILPVLLIIIAIASVAANYNKLSKQRMEDAKKRMANRQNAKDAMKAKENIIQVHPTVMETMLSEPVQKVVAPSGQSLKPRVSAKDIKRAVIMTEILNKPVSLREK